MAEEAGPLALKASQRHPLALKNFIGSRKRREKEELRDITLAQGQGTSQKGTVDRYRPQGYSESPRIGAN